MVPTAGAWLLKMSVIEPRDKRFGADELPVTVNQDERLRMEAMMRFRNGYVSPFHAALGFQLDNEIDISALERSLNWVIERHAGLRSIYFRASNGLSSAKQIGATRLPGRQTLAE